MLLRPLWESLCAEGNYTVFQRFDLNLLAAERFADREESYVVCAESERRCGDCSGGAAAERWNDKTAGRRTV